MESRESLCVHRPKILSVSVGPQYDKLTERIRHLCKNVFDHLLVAPSQSKTNRREQKLYFDTSQLVRIRNLEAH